MRASLAIALALALPATALAGALTDGSVGPVQSLSGHFTVPQALGTVKGANLFHSFASFGIANGESATFTTSSAAIARVISRVTGGQPSAIFGPLTLQAAAGGRPDFYFVNPAGVLFGAGAQIDVPGGFHVSTAQQLKFADGFAWDTGSPTSSGLTVAAPESFGFLGGNARAAIRFTSLDAEGNAGDSPIVTLPAGSSLTVAAGDVELSGTTLQLPPVLVQVAAIGTAPAEVPLVISANTRSTPLAGSIRFDKSDLIGSSPGITVLRAGSIDLVDSTVNVFSYGLPKGTEPGALIVNAAGRLSLDGGVIGSYTDCDVAAPRIEVSAGTLEIEFGTIMSGTSYGNGVAGAIAIDVKGATTMHASSILSGTYLGQSTADAGPVTIRTGSLVVDGGDIVSGAVLSSGSSANVTINVDTDVALSNGAVIRSSALYGHNSGDLNITAGGAIAIDSGASIRTGAWNSTGKSGPLSINADSLTIDGTGIDSSTFSSPENAGPITIDVRHAVNLRNGGRIQSVTVDGGNAGTIVVKARELNVVGSPGVDTWILTDTLAGNGKGGTVDIQADRIAIARGGLISSSTHSAGRGGTVVLNAGTISIDGGDASGTGSTGLVAAAMAGSSGQTGELQVHARGGISLLNGGTISIRNDATVAAPSALVPSTLSVSATNVSLDHAEITAEATGNARASNIDIATGNCLTLKSSSVRTSAVDGDGGSIRLAGNLIRLSDSLVTTSVEGQTNGNGGNIDITGNALVLKSGFIQANTLAPLARGGNININTRLLIPEGGTLVLGGARVPFGSGYAGFNVIQAAAPDGVSGELVITTPEMNLAGTLSGLSTPVVDFGPLARDQCRTGSGSSFTLTGRGTPPASMADIDR